MVLDASAIIAILAMEDDAASLAARLARVGSARVSAVAIYEASVGLARIGNVSATDALYIVETFLTEVNAIVIPIDATTAREALSAFSRFGKGRHPAALNMGDCFAYACARLAGEPLLCKGNDFPRTDLKLA